MKRLTLRERRGDAAAQVLNALVDEGYAVLEMFEFPHSLSVVLVEGESDVRYVGRTIKMSSRFRPKRALKKMFGTLPDDITLVAKYQRHRRFIFLFEQS